MDRSYAVRQKHSNLPTDLLLITPLQDAIAALNTLQSNFAVVDAIRKSRHASIKASIPEMVDWCRKIGYEVCVDRCWLYNQSPAEDAVAI